MIFQDFLKLSVALLLLVAAGCAGADVLLAEGGAARIAALPHALYLGETHPELSLEAALATPERFQPPAQSRLHVDAAIHWLRLALRNDTTTVQQRVLSLGVPDIETLEVYRVSRGSGVSLLALHRDSPFSARPLAERVLAIPLELAAHERVELMLRYRTHAATPLTPELFTPDAFRKALAEANLFNGVVLGVLLVLALLALLQYLAGEQPAFLAYFSMALLMMAFLLQFEGYNFAHLWPARGEWNQVAPVLLVGGIQLTHVLFAVTLFNLRRDHPALYRLYLGYLAILAVSIGLFLATGWNWGGLLAALAYVLLSVAVGIHFLRRRAAVAGLFLAGTLSHVVFTNLLFGLSVFGVDIAGGAVSPFAYLKIGYLTEALIFAVALARQMQALRRQVEDGLRARLAEAEHLARAEAEKHEMLLAAQQHQLQLAAAGHDLSQPIASIRLALTALRSRNGEEATARHIDQALDYTESLLRTLVDEARRDHAAASAGVDLDDLLEQAHQRHLGAARAKGLRLRLRPSGCRIPGSPLVLARILDNLVGNAVRYTASGSILIGARRRPGAVEIQVLDNGPGLDAAQQRKLSEPFTQSGKLAEERHGYGLGLYIVRTLCEQWGYRLTVGSTPGRGTRFGVVVPTSQWNSASQSKTRS